MLSPKIQTQGGEEQELKGQLCLHTPANTFSPVLQYIHFFRPFLYIQANASTAPGSVPGVGSCQATPLESDCPPSSPSLSRQELHGILISSPTDLFLIPARPGVLTSPAGGLRRCSITDDLLYVYARTLQEYMCTCVCMSELWSAVLIFHSVVNH